MSANAGLWGATIGAVTGYTAAVLAPFWPALYYYPALDAWRLAQVDGETPVRWYGFMLYALAGGLIGALLGRWFKRSPSWPLVLGYALVCLFALAWHEKRWFGG